MPSTLTLQNVVNWARTQVRMIPLVGVGGIANEPALSLCNDTLQALLSAPYAWRFNKKQMPAFTTVPYQQDYILSGCTLTVANKAVVHLNAALSGTPGLTQSNTTVTATFSDFAPNGINPIINFATGDSFTIAGAGQSGYNISGTLTAVPNSTSVQFTTTAGLTSDGGQGITDVSWVEHCTLQDFFSTATVKPVHDIEVVASLPIESIIQPPMKIAFQSENITTNSLTMRCWPVPSSQIWNVFTNYQSKAPLLTSLLSTWSPWPDELGYVLRSGFRAKVLDHAEDPRAMQAQMLWQQDVAKALDIKDQEQRHEAFFPDMPLMRGG